MDVRPCLPFVPVCAMEPRMLPIGTVVRANLANSRPLSKLLGAHALLHFQQTSISRWVAVPLTHKLSPPREGFDSRRMATPSVCSSFFRSQPSSTKLFLMNWSLPQAIQHTMFGTESDRSAARGGVWQVLPHLSGVSAVRVHRAVHVAPNPGLDRGVGRRARTCRPRGFQRDFMEHKMCVLARTSGRLGILACRPARACGGPSYSS